MKRSRPKTRWSLILVLGLALALTFVGYKYLSPTPETASIFVVSEPLEYGDVTLTGTLRKDAPLGQAGNYYLVLKNGATIALDSLGLDGLTNAMVTATGYLTPAGDATYPNMAVSTITVAN